MKLFAYAAAACSALALAVMPVSAQDWNATQTKTAGGHLLGNPQAQTKLITFVSYSCPHCGHFEEESDAPLRLSYVQTGKVSLEVHHIIRNPIDLAAALLTECGDNRKFFQNHRAVFAKQDEWLDKATKMSAAQQQRWGTGALPQRLQAISSDLGFYDIMTGRGYSRAQLDQCLSDEGKAKALVAQMQADNAKWEIPGTPSFVLNGVLLDGVHTWASLQPRLAASVK